MGELELLDRLSMRRALQSGLPIIGLISFKDPQGSGEAILAVYCESGSCVLGPFEAGHPQDGSYPEGSRDTYDSDQRIYSGLELQRDAFSDCMSANRNVFCFGCGKKSLQNAMCSFAIRETPIYYFVARTSRPTKLFCI